MRTLSVFLTFATLAVLVAVPAAVRAQSATPIPPAPTRLTPPSFSAERDGRRLLFQARDAAQASDSRTALCRITTVTELGPGRPNSVQATTETLSVAPQSEQLALSVERRDGKNHRIHRLVRDAGALVAVRYDSVDGAIKRETARASVETGENRWIEIASRCGVDSASRAVRLALDPDFGMVGTAWRDVSGAVIEVPATRRPNDPVQVHRWQFDRPGGRLVRFESWTTVRGPRRPARGKNPADSGVRVTYVREDVSYSPVSRDAFGQTLPATYQEVPAPSLPAPRPAAPVDPRASALLAQWSRAWERPLALSATVDATFEVEERVAGTRPPRRIPGPYRANLWLRRPGRARIDGEGTGRVTAMAVADGAQARSTRRTVPVQNGERLWRTLASAGASDSGALLDWFFDGPPEWEGFESVRSLGEGVSSTGEPVDLIEARRVVERAGDNARATRTILTVLIGLGSRDHLPREARIHTQTRVQDLTESDQPLAFTQIVRWSDVFVDAETAPSRFELP